MDDSLLPVTSLRENLIQAYLDFSYFRTTEPKLLRLCARCHSQTYETPFRWATHASTNHHLFSNSPNNLFINIHFFPKHYNCIFDISCYTTSIAIRSAFHSVIFLNTLLITSGTSPAISENYCENHLIFYNQRRKLWGKQKKTQPHQTRFCAEKIPGCIIPQDLQ